MSYRVVFVCATFLPTRLSACSRKQRTNVLGLDCQGQPPYVKPAQNLGAERPRLLQDVTIPQAEYNLL